MILVLVLSVAIVSLSVWVLVLTALYQGARHLCRSYMVRNVALEWFQAIPPEPDYAGGRLFVRYADAGGDEPSWDDWRFAAVVRPRDRLQWLSDPPPWAKKLVEESVAAGTHYASVDDGRLYLEWVVAGGDGPEGPRLYDEPDG